MKNEKSPELPNENTDSAQSNLTQENHAHETSSSASAEKASSKKKTEKHQKHMDVHPQNKQQAQAAKTTQSAFSGVSITLIAAVIIIAIGGNYFLSQNNTNSYKAEINSLKNQIDNATKQPNLDLPNLASTLSPQLNALESRLRADVDNLREQNTKLQTQQNTQFATLEQQLSAQQITIKQLNEQIDTLNSDETPSWARIQINYFAKMADQALFVNQDVKNGLYLLNAIKAGLELLPDPALASELQKVDHNIQQLSRLSIPDFNALTEQLTQLANQVDDLVFMPITETQPETSENVSASVSDWKENLKRNWHSITSQFISVKKRENVAVSDCLKDKKTSAACQTLLGLQSPKQQHYLRENIKMQLFIAEQAIIKHRQETYQTALTNVIHWINAYFDINESKTKTFLDKVTHLSLQKVDFRNELNTLQTISIPEKPFSRKSKTAKTVIQNTTQAVNHSEPKPAQNPIENDAQQPAKTEQNTAPVAEKPAEIKPVSTETAANAIASENNTINTTKITTIQE